MRVRPSLAAGGIPLVPTLRADVKVAASWTVIPTSLHDEALAALGVASAGQVVGRAVDCVRATADGEQPS